MKLAGLSAAAEDDARGPPLHDDHSSEESDRDPVVTFSAVHTPRRRSSLSFAGPMMESSDSRTGSQSNIELHTTDNVMSGADRRHSTARRRAVVSRDDLRFHTEDELLRVTLPLDDLTLLDAVPSAIIVASTIGLMVSANAYAHRMLRYEPGELLGRPLEIIMPRDFREGHRALMECVARDAARWCGSSTHNNRAALWLAAACLCTTGCPAFSATAADRCPACARTAASCPC